MVKAYLTRANIRLDRALNLISSNPDGNCGIVDGTLPDPLPVTFDRENKDVRISGAFFTSGSVSARLNGGQLPISIEMPHSELGNIAPAENLIWANPQT